MNRTVQKFIENLELKGKILEVGSRDINGNVRHLFQDYIGMDFISGKNVDVLATSWQIPFKSDCFDNVLCLEMLEHDMMFWFSVPEMIRVLKPKGKFVVSVPGMFMFHHPNPIDYWRFNVHSIKFLMKELEDVHVKEDPRGTVLFIKAIPEGTIFSWEEDLFEEDIKNHVKEGYAVIPVGEILAYGTKRED